MLKSELGLFALCGLLLLGPRVASAAEYVGQVSFAGIAVPGATVVATQDDRRLESTTDAEGVFRLADVPDGTWTIAIEMRGFAPLTRAVTIGPDAQPEAWELVLLPFEEIVRGLPPPPVPAAAPPDASGSTSPPAGTTTPVVGTGFRAASIAPGARPSTAVARPSTDAAPPIEAPDADAAAAADGFLINGSVNNGAASPFAQPAAFGNSRRRPGALYNGMFGGLGSNSIFDSKPYSITGLDTPRPDYHNLHLLATFGGPLRIPRLARTGPNLFVGYQRVANDNVLAQPALVPTDRERTGDFSRSLDPSGQPIRIVDPVTGQPFPGGVIPADRISPQAAALLGYYPHATLAEPGPYNFQAPTVSRIRQDSVQSQLMQFVNPRDQVSANINYQRTATAATTIFGFEDETVASALDVRMGWNHRVSPQLLLRTRYQFTQQTTDTTPYFANRTNVSGEAGIGGNNQEPVNWGPPTLAFASGLAGLTDALPQYQRARSHGGGLDGFLARGRHNLSLGGDVRRRNIDILAQQDPRGTFTFTGALTGSDLADFLLGVPAASSIATGNADKYLRGMSYAAYVSDDWRVGPSLTITAGVRWEYDSPLSERYARLVNLDVAPGFTAISPTLASDPTGTLTGRTLPAALVEPDWSGFQPRLAMAWRPIAGSSVVVRAGYGVYRNTLPYDSITTLMAQQPPLSQTQNLANSPENPLTLANGFTAPAGATLNTFALDPDFRVGSVHTWQASLQRDLPASLTVNATYLGSRGVRLIQEFLPNTYPPGVTPPCTACPSGFVYLTSGGSSTRHAGQLQVRRRLRNGLTATVQYTLARATDNAAAYTAATLSGTAFAQNWLDLDAEYAPANLDQRHLLNVQFQYTSGVGVAGGALVDGWAGALLRGWTLSADLTAGSGMPLTPYYLRTTPGTGFTGAIRAARTDAPLTPPEGYYLNPEAYAAPPAGAWGDAGRNSGRGASQVLLNAGIMRTFPWGSRRNVDWRIDATNVLNQVNYTNINTLVGSPQFGLPTTAGLMRRIQTSLRVRF